MTGYQVPVPTSVTPRFDDPRRWNRPRWSYVRSQWDSVRCHRGTQSKHCCHEQSMNAPFNLSPTHLAPGPAPESGRAASFRPAPSRPEPLRGKGRIRIFLPPAGDSDHHHDRSMWIRSHLNTRPDTSHSNEWQAVVEDGLLSPIGEQLARADRFGRGASRHSPAHIRSRVQQMSQSRHSLNVVLASTVSG